MRLSFVFLFASLLAISLAESNAPAGYSQPKGVCVQILQKISNASNVYYPGNATYAKGIHHWASSSEQNSTCVVEPGSAKDVGIVLGILGSTRNPFAVKGAGHAMNQGFSSTPGVHISMYRFSDVVYNASSQTVEVGTGLVWDDVYAALGPYNVNVVGGRVSGVGVAGLTLGGGYSWKTNQHGLTIDTVTAFELVKPNGDVVCVTQESDSELFFGLKGGYNNFGIVTKFTLQTFPQGEIWGGSINFAPPNLDQVTAAIANFSAAPQDPKAGMIANYGYEQGQASIGLYLFYDAPSVPAGIFDELLAIPSSNQDLATRSFAGLVQFFNANLAPHERGLFNSAPLLSYTPKVLAAIMNETTYWGSTLSLKSGNLFSYSVEPFLPSIFSHNAVGSTAYPPVRTVGFSPFNLYYGWSSSEFDDDFHKAALLSAAQIHKVAVAEGQDLTGAAAYPNNALYDTPLQNIYGQNVPRLKALKEAVDPSNVMGLAGGFKF